MASSKPADFHRLFYTALQANDCANAKVLLTQYPNFANALLPGFSYPPLIAAGELGHVAFVALLIDQGADIYKYYSDGLTVFSYAKKYYKPQIVAAFERGHFRHLAAITKPWVKSGDKEATHIQISIETGRKLTEIFNFQSRRKTTIHENLSTSQETVLPHERFDDLDPPEVEQALDAFERLGGTVDRSYALQGHYLKKK